MAFKKELFINFLFAIIPITFILGNLLLNLNILLIILFSLYIYRLRIFEEKFSSIDKLLLCFFLYIFANGLINNYLSGLDSNIILIKSLGYFRFLILYFIIKFYVKKNIINYKYLFFSFGSVCLFVSIDIIIQYIFSQDIFGYKSIRSHRVLSGPFGDEYVAGSFIQRFYIFAIYFILLFTKFKKIQTQNFLIYTSAIIFLFGTFLAGNRFPFFLFILILVLFFLFEKQIRTKFLIIFTAIILILSFNLSSNKHIVTHYSSFVDRGIEIKDYVLKRIKSEEYNIPNVYAKELETGFLVWENNKFFGGGIKSFYYNCAKVKSSALDRIGGTSCNTHPHNYYLHISTELGLIGLLFSLILFFSIMLRSLKIIFFSENITHRKTLLPFFLVFLAEIFPFKTSGSFFTSVNSIVLFFVISFIVGLFELKRKNKI
tara:strand:+ start:54 stop:1343 length:1290 start_codon:yes stop_codon:yes gene_type:complete